MSYESTTTIQGCFLNTMPLRRFSLPHILHVPGATLLGGAVHLVISFAGARVNAAMLDALEVI